MSILYVLCLLLNLRLARTNKRRLEGGWWGGGGGGDMYVCVCVCVWGGGNSA